MNTNRLWRAGPNLSDIELGKLIEIPVEGKVICFLRSNTDKIYAVSPLCPHAGGRLCEGYINGQGHIVCSLHGYKFNPASGHNSSGEGYHLKTFSVKIEAGRIFVLY